MINETGSSRTWPGRRCFHGVAWRSLLAGLLLVTSCGDGSTDPGNESPGTPSATRLAITTQPSSGAQSGVAFSTQPVVQLRDASGISVSESGVSVTASIASGGGFLGGATTVATNASGQATFTNLQITGALGDRTLSFTSGTLTATTSSTINVNTAGAETQLFIATQPSDATSGAPFVQQPAIQLQDASGNNVSKSGVSVTAELASGSGVLTGAGAISPGGALSAEATRARGLASRGSRMTVQTDANGLASFTSLTITGQLDHTLVFSAAGLTSALSDVLTVAPPPPVPLLDGVPVTGLAGNMGEAVYYFINVPAGAPQLDVLISGGTGDADLYLQAGQVPTTTVYDCSSFLPGNNDACTEVNPASGDWFIMLVAFEDYSGVTLTASVATPGCTLSSLPDTDGDRLPDCVETAASMKSLDVSFAGRPLLATTSLDSVIPARQSSRVAAIPPWPCLVDSFALTARRERSLCSIKRSSSESETALRISKPRAEPLYNNTDGKRVVHEHTRRASTGVKVTVYGILYFQLWNPKDCAEVAS